MSPDSGGICMEVDQGNHQFAPGLSPRWIECGREGKTDDENLDVLLAFQSRVLLHGYRGYLAYKKPPPHREPTVGPCLGSGAGPRGGGGFL